MQDMMDKILTIGMIVTAAFTAWAVLTPNHLFVG
jgi:hypothetical protein